MVCSSVGEDSILAKNRRELSSIGWKMIRATSDPKGSPSVTKRVPDAGLGMCHNG